MLNRKESPAGKAGWLLALLKLVTERQSNTTYGKERTLI